MRSGALVGGRYRLRERLGAGGAGEVWRAVDERLAAPVAIKLLHDTRPDQAARLAREARVLARLAHPRIVRATDCDPDHDPPYLVMELVEGGTLQDRGTPLPPGEVRETLDAILEALEAAHTAGVVHRDLTPANVLLDRTGGVVVTDFGLARSGQEARVTAAGMLVGTPEYWSPEQARGERPTAAGDLYATGTIAFELLAGRLPFPSTSDADRLMASSRRLVEEPPPVASVAPDAAAADPELAELIDDLLSRDPDARPPASVGRRRLATGATVHLQSAATVPIDSAPAARRPSWVTRAAFAAIAVAAGAAIAVAAIDSGGGRPATLAAQGTGAAPDRVAAAPADTSPTAPEAAPDGPGTTVPLANLESGTDAAPSGRAAWGAAALAAAGADREQLIGDAQTLLQRGADKAKGNAKPDKGKKSDGKRGLSAQRGWKEADGRDVERLAQGVAERLAALDAPDDEARQAQNALAAAEAAIAQAVVDGAPEGLQQALAAEAQAFATLQAVARA